MNEHKDPLDALLDRWGQNPPDAERLEPEVWRRIAVADAEEKPSLFDRIKTVFSRPSFAIAFSAACILLGLFLVQLHISHREQARNQELAKEYLRLVDPLLQPDSATASTAKTENLDALFAWMKSDLQLNDQQLARIRSVHEQFGPHLQTLSARVAQMQQALAAFEKARQSIGQVDFVEFARFVEQRRTLDRECNESTRKLIAESTELMTPRQREQYLQLLTPALNTSTSGSL
jgi:hypothetical protein